MADIARNWRNRVKFLFRADASLAIGSGHIMRCLTLAQALREQGHSIHFICRAHVGHLYDYIMAQGFTVHLLPKPSSCFSLTSAVPHATWLGVSEAEDFSDCETVLREWVPDWIVCDHYALSVDWEKRARAVCASKIMVIDDLHDRLHDADLLLDQNLGHTVDDYVGLVPPYCHVLAGTRYALLRSEFVQWREYSLSHRQTYCKGVQSILVNLGGVDVDNRTLDILHVLQEVVSSQCEVTVVMGKTAPHTDTIYHFAEAAPYRCQVLTAVNNMAELMAKSDLAIGAAGSSAWERCCLGLPTAMLVLADNQQTIADALSKKGAAYVLTKHREATELRRILTDAVALVGQSAVASVLCDGMGVVRVVQHLIDPLPSFATLSPVSMDDLETIRHWRNHINIRRWMFSQEQITAQQHKQWFLKRQNHTDFSMRLYCVDGHAQGFVSFTCRAENVWEWGFYLSPDCSRGHGQWLGKLALQYAFSQLGAWQVSAQVLSYNERSLILHQKLGFQETACLKQAHWFNGQTWDIVQFVMLAKDFPY